jgi:DNA-binding winged helix-turn-helix (wHTH) protein/TolB-like protein/tetratricopeptide (TPR) repeat protein
MTDSQLQIYEFDKFRIEVAKRLLLRNGEPVPLAPKAFDTLLVLVTHHGEVLDKDRLLTLLWPDSIVEEANLPQNISALRKALGESPNERKYIVTIPGKGYKFAAEVKALQSAEDMVVLERHVMARITVHEQENSTNQIALDEGRMPADLKPTRNRKWLSAFAVLSVFALGATGFYLWRENAKSVVAPIKTVAVLPFKPLVVENRNEELEFGMADTLIAKLSGGDEVIVRPLSAIRRYNAVEQDALTAGRELRVESILDGTIQTSGDRIRISAKLLRTSDGKQLWAAQFDEKFTDIFVVQDLIAEKVATALIIRLSNLEKKHSTDNIEAYQLYMKGRYHLDKLTPPDMQKSITYFQQAIDLDPGYALAYTGLSQAFGVLGIAGAMPVAEAFIKANAAAQKAIEIDDMFGDAHVALGMGMFWYGWDWNAAEKEFLRAIEINPNNADSHGNFAMVLSNIGRHAEALAESKRSLELNPLHLAQNTTEGQFLLNAGRPDEALMQLRKTIELEPKFWMPHMIAASAYIEKGMYMEAIEESRKEYELTGGNIIPFGTYALAKSGKSEEARAVLKELLKLSATGYVPPYNIALIYNALDERDNALGWLEKAYEQRDPKMTALKVEAKWNNLRDEPRFIKLIQRMKLQ